MSIKAVSQSPSPPVYLINKFKQVIHHPWTPTIIKEIVIFGTFLGLLLGGGTCTFIASHLFTPMTVYDLAGQKFFAIKVVSLAGRIKVMVLMGVGGAVAGVGLFGILQRGANKILDLKDRVSDLARKRAQTPKTTKVQKTIDKILFISTKALVWGNAIRDLNNHVMVTILKISVGLTFIIGGGGVLSLSIYYYVHLSHVITGVNGTFLCVKNPWAWFALVGLNRGSSMFGGAIYEVAQMVICKIGQKLRSYLPSCTKVN
jgi:hypothetical protein